MTFHALKDMIPLEIKSNVLEDIIKKIFHVFMLVFSVRKPTQESTISWLLRTEDIPENVLDSVLLQIIFADLTLLHHELHVPVQPAHDDHPEGLVVAAPDRETAPPVPWHLGSEHTGVPLLQHQDHGDAICPAQAQR